MKTKFLKKKTKQPYYFADGKLKVSNISLTCSALRKRAVAGAVTNIEFGMPSIPFGSKSIPPSRLTTVLKSLDLVESISMMANACNMSSTILDGFAGGNLKVVTFSETTVKGGQVTDLCSSFSRLTHLGHLEYSRATYEDGSAYHLLKTWGKMNLNSLKLVAIVFHETKPSAFTNLLLMSSSLKELDLYQATLDPCSASCLYRGVAHNSTLKALSLFRVAGVLDNKNIVSLVSSLFQRKKGIFFNQAVGQFTDTGAYVLAKAIENSLLFGLILRQSKIGAAGLVHICSSMLKQEVCVKLGFRFLKEVAPEAWEGVALMIRYVKGLKKVRYSRPMLTEDMKNAFDDRPDIATSGFNI